MSTLFFHHGGGTIVYDDQGPGPLIACVPSMGDLRAEYRFLAPRLVAGGFRVVTMDVRGHGESSTGWPDYSVGAIGGDILALVRHFDAGLALVVGTSMAAGAGVWAAAEGPGQVAGLVLIGPFVRDVMPAWQAKALFGPLFAGPWARAALMRYFPTLFPGAKPEDFPQYLAALRANLGERGRMVALRRMITASKRAAEERLGRVTAPTLVVMGSRDPDFRDPAAEAALVARRLNGTVRMVEGTGHYPHVERPDETAELIIPFARKVHPAIGRAA